MKTRLFAAALVAMFGIAPAHADGNLAKSKQCFTCHNVDRQLNGPSFKAIAKLYKGTDEAEEKLAEKIRKGGAEHWGPKIMPTALVRGVAISEAEAKQLAQWVLSQ